MCVCCTEVVPFSKESIAEFIKACGGTVLEEFKMADVRHAESSRVLLSLITDCF